METKQSMIGQYCKNSTDKRFDYIYMNYKNFIGLIAGYREGLAFLISSQKAYNRKSKQENLGVRVQIVQGLSDLTANMAIENVMVKEQIDNCHISTELLIGVDDREEVALALFELQLMKQELQVFDFQLQTFREEDFMILSSYLNRNRSVRELADDMAIESESVNKRLYRLKRKLKERMIPFMKEY
jgi:Ran GTPase-activating protein (RanGAP) involved in mRNA processing and transport